jgi:hypothetical protein
VAAAAEDLREAAGLIPHAEGEARRTAAEILEDWQQQASGGSEDR